MYAYGSMFLSMLEVRTKTMINSTLMMVAPANANTKFSHIWNIGCAVGCGSWLGSFFDPLIYIVHRSLHRNFPIDYLKRKQNFKSNE